ncbi:GNAT family N-acetyltransferase [Sporomusa sp. KB1]|jgi:predicted GNAT family acetyltransferase|uniref:GNAT family N-acetyltransferase n=1 Tax=Sporomusa sp. KB1 TaxID=943346 RepID=UPI0011A5AC0E|nr:GNAT family N-acetyltransferase [Sporomusa sp. KB1]TWH47843.1 hypothetical protein Salpa_3949 [Sporomusa sp. KB1]
MIRLLTGDDNPEVKAYLERNYMETALLSGNLARCGIDNDRMSRRAGDYYGYFSAGRLEGILAFFNLGNVVPHFEAAKAIGSFIEIMRQRRFEVLVGMKRLVEPLCLALAPYKKVRDCENSYYLVNHEIRPYSLDCVHQIAAVEAVDREMALTFIVEAYRQGFKRRFNQELAVKLIEDRGPEETLLFLLINKMPVAQAIIQVATGRINQIGGVYTSEHSRGKGYCKALVAELCGQIHAAGKIPTLMVRKDNSPAVRAYQALGFAYYDEYLIVKFAV